MSSIFKTGFGKIILGGGVLIVIVAAALLFQLGSNDVSSQPDINILTRHDVSITNKFTEEFLKSSLAQDLGYTENDNEKINFVSVSTTQGWLKALDSDNKVIDLAWGGGPTLFNQMSQANLLKPITDQDLIDIVDAAVPDTVAGVDMKQYQDGDLIWVANAISSFGFTINTDILTDFGLPTPTTWEDLASPDFFVSTEVASISLGNPTQTTSNTRIYHIIIQKFGWDKGWEILGRMAGNGGMFGGSVDTRAAIISGTVPSGMTIDFYGVIAQRECSSCEYVIPTNGSVVNGDPIAFGRKGKNLEGSRAFFEYVNSPEGQAVWIENDRLPINVATFNTPKGKARPDVKALYDVTLTNKGIDFNETLALQFEFTMQNYFESAYAEPHTELKTAWSKAVLALRAGDISQSTFDSDVAALFAPQFTQEEAIAGNAKLIVDSGALLSNQSNWLSAAENRYNSFAPLNNLESSNSNTIQKPTNNNEITSILSTNYFQMVVVKNKNKTFFFES